MIALVERVREQTEKRGLRGEKVETDAALYLFADGEQSVKGSSLTFEQVTATPFIARITRVR